MGWIERFLSVVAASLSIVAPAHAQQVPEPLPIVLGIPAPPNSEVIALCPDVGEFPEVWTARDHGLGLAGRLAQRGYKVFLVDPWDSTEARVDGFDGVVRTSYPVLMDRLAELGNGRVTWIGHGLCGMLPIAAAARASVRTPAARWVALGTRFVYRSPSPLLEQWLAGWQGAERPLPELLENLLFTGLRTQYGSRPSSVPPTIEGEGTTPAQILESFHRHKLSRPPARAVLEDMTRWFETGSLTDTEGWTDYTLGVATVPGRALIVAGASDPLAPPEDVLPVLDGLPESAAAQFELLSRVNGDREEYGHLGMLLSRNSARDVDKLIARWLAVGR
jgi:hypothetical protein